MSGQFLYQNRNEISVVTKLKHVFLIQTSNHTTKVQLNAIFGQESSLLKTVHNSYYYTHDSRALSLLAGCQE